MIDPDTNEVKTLRGRDKKELTLVMSDEFNMNDRSFLKGDDSLFTAIHQPGLTNEEIQFYDQSYVSTRDGFLILKTTAERSSWTEFDEGLQQDKVMTRNYTSAMLQSWNQFCFTGGVLEMSIQLPGGSKEGAGGLWPAAWLMGNLARAAFPTSTKAVWPWSYDACDGSIPHLANRQEINACLDSPGHGLHPHQGRGSPEIDLFEVNSVPNQPSKAKSNNKNNGDKVAFSSESPAFMSTSLQISPGVSKPKRPVNGHPLNDSYTWYDRIQISEFGEYNAGFWGQECAPINDHTPTEEYKYWEDAVSANFHLGDAYFREPHTYRLEWQPGKQGGYLEWYLDGDLMMGVEAESLMTLTGSLIPVEPMYLVFNTAVSQSWGFPNPCDKEQCNACYDCFDCHNPDCQCSLPDSMKNCANLPAEMKIDYIRLYQDPADSSHTTSCSPDAYPTQQFILDHAERFQEWAPKKRAPPSPMLMPEATNEDTIKSNEMFTLFCLLAVCLVFWGGVTFVVTKFRKGANATRHSQEQVLHQQGEGHEIIDHADHDQINENTSLLSKKTSYGV